MTSLIAGLFMIGFLVVIHEAGHFVAAKIFKVGVPVFSVGMGPRVFGVQWRGTDYRVSALPVGGYVQMSGADPFGEEDTAAWVDPAEDFMNKPVWQRLIIMAAGPGVNLALPFVLFTVLLMLGRPDWNSRVGAVLPGTPAEAAGLEVDDVVTAVDGDPIQIWHDVETEVAERIGSQGTVTLTVERDGTPVQVTLGADALRRDPQGEPDMIGLGIQPFYLSTRVGITSPGGPAAAAGLVTGDRILEVDGDEVQHWEALLGALDGPTHTLTVQRGFGEVDDPEELTVELVRGDGVVAVPGDPYTNPWGVAPITVFARSIEEGGPAAKAGVQEGDRFLSVDGHPVLTFHHFIDHVARTAADGGVPRPLELTVVRGGDLVSMSMTPEVKVVTGEAYSRPIIGVSSFAGMGVAIDQVRKYYSFFEAVPRAVDESVEVVKSTASILGHIFTGRADPRDNVGGPVAIFVAAGTVAEQGFFQYAAVIGMLSVSLGVINLLPVPVLDGGQIVFYLLEAIRGRPLSLELREKFQMVGVVALVILMLLVTVNDIQRWVFL